MRLDADKPVRYNQGHACLQTVHRQTHAVQLALHTAVMRLFGTLAPSSCQRTVPIAHSGNSCNYTI